MKRRNFLKAFGYGLSASVLNYTIGKAPVAFAANPFNPPPRESRDTAMPASQVQTALSQNLVDTPFTLVEDFEDQASWTNVSSVVHDNNTTEFATGTKSQKVTTTVPGGNGYIRKNVAFAPGSPNTCRLRFYLHDLNTASISLYLATGSGNYWMAGLDLKGTNYRAPTGVWVAWDITSWSSGGGKPNWANGITQIRCNVRAKTGVTTSVSFDSLEFYGKTKPVLLLMADDGYPAVNTVALPYLQARNMVMTAYVIPGYVGKSKYMTLSQLHEIYDYGFDVANHTYSHQDLTTKTDAEIQVEWTAARDYLVANGMPRAALHGCCPGGAGVWNDAVIASTKAAGMSTMALRRVVSFAEPILDWYDIRRSTVLSNATTLDQAKAAADRAYADSLIFPVLFHNLISGIPTSNVQWNITDFQNLIDYIQQKGFISLTINELYELRNGPLIVNHC